MSDTNSATAENKSATAASQTDVYAITGADPEVLAYAMAKYSRSSLNMKESLAEISSQRAEQFLNTSTSNTGTALSPTSRTSPSPSSVSRSSPR